MRGLPTFAMMPLAHFSVEQSNQGHVSNYFDPSGHIGEVQSATPAAVQDIQQPGNGVHIMYMR